MQLGMIRWIHGCCSAWRRECNNSRTCASCADVSRHIVCAWIIATSLILDGCGALSGSSRYCGWRQATTPHFVVRSDFDEPTITKAALELERTRDELVSAAWPAIDFSQVRYTEVYLLSSSAEFERLVGPWIEGAFENGPRPAFYLSGSSEGWDRGPGWDRGSGSRWMTATSVLRHEMAHQLAAVVFPNEPRWFAEGLAEFLETIHRSDGGRSVVLGEINREALSKWLNGPTVSVQEVLAWRERPSEIVADKTRALHGKSWLFVHWLFNIHAEAFSHYQIELARGVEPKRAWDAAFPGFDSEGADIEIGKYVVHTKYQVFARPLHTSQPAIQVVGLTQADAHVARARIALLAAGLSTTREKLKNEANDEIGRALELDPTHVEALELDLPRRPFDCVERAHRATEAHPKDARAFALLAHCLAWSKIRIEEQESAYRKSLVLDQNNPGVLNDLAWLLLEQHRTSEGLPLALHAAKLAPFNYAIIDTLAVAYFQAGRCRAAIDHEQRALELVAELPGSRPNPTDLMKHLSEFTAACNEAGPAR
jgi:tetratricopeptide (TPR) repeat protein